MNMFFDYIYNLVSQHQFNTSSLLVTQLENVIGNKEVLIRIYRNAKFVSYRLNSINEYFSQSFP